jgi:hypothetical protein
MDKGVHEHIVGEAGLTQAKGVAAAAKLEVRLCNGEAVV